MRDLEKFHGVIPAFYACYDEEGNVSPERVRALTRYFIESGVKGAYVGGSSGECIYQTVADRSLKRAASLVWIAISSTVSS